MSQKSLIDSSRSREKTRAIDYRSELNAAQYEAVTTIEGPVLVVAGAGSGKTRALVFRVAFLVEQGVTPESILLLTFTRKAAAEMLRRATELVGPGCARVSGGTFHALAHELLRVWAGRVGFPADFGIMDRGDMEELLGQLRKQAGLAGKDKRFPHRGTLANIVSKAANKVMDISELLENEYAHLLRFAKKIKALARDYTIYKQENALLDLDDLLLLFHKLLTQDSEAQEKIASRYQYIMVDEFQDTNPIQAEIVHLLGRGHQNVMTVGDEAQSIYSFRGASFKNIMDFPRRFPEARIIHLEENYRSRQPILDLTNHIISRARERYEKKLFTRRAGGELPRIIPLSSEKEQSLFICHKIRELVDSGQQPDSIAVLFRAARHSFGLEVELLLHDIDFVKYGGRRFLEKAHVKDLLSLLRVVSSPGDRVSLNRVLLQQEGVGSKTGAKIVDWVEGRRERLVSLDQYPGSARLQKSLSGLASLFKDIGARGVVLKERISRAWDFYRPFMEYKFPDDYPDRINDIEEFLRLAEGYGSLNRLLGDMALEPPDASLSRPRSGNPSHRLVLSTVHSAKGLEWHTVFIIWATQGRFPPPFIKRTVEELEEERRLMYVAATRAKENLYFLCPLEEQSGEGLFRPGLSPFLADVPPNLAAIGLERMEVRVSKAGPPKPLVQPPPGGFALNERVRHRVFGFGRVVRLISKQKIQVDFDHFGVKTLLIDYAGLQRING
ncbi:MAG: ATP-dependent helicase [Deltaproteobacteria bacterium]|nr:ATP-dependent helicase [Deltaproteobacteria bacterium]